MSWDLGSGGLARSLCSLDERDGVKSTRPADFFGSAGREEVLLDLDIVEGVSAVSLLQIAPVGERADLLYSMRDNARQPTEKSIFPSYPWSIAVPMNQHWIVVDSKSTINQPKPIGIDELRVGSTFIIPRGEPT